MLINYIFGTVTGRRRCWHRCIVALALAFTTLAARAQSCDQAPPGIVSWWSGESNALDNLGINNGVPLNGASYAPGKDGTAFNFNGNQWVRVPDAPGLQFTTGMTLEAWVNPRAYNGGADSCILAKYGGFVAGQSAYSFYLHSDHLGKIQLSTDGSSAAVIVSTTAVCPTNTWTHLAATYDGSTLSIYFNGSLQGSTNFSGSIFPGTFDLGIGAALGGGGTNAGAAVFNGLIDEPAVYNRALSASEILALYQAGAAGKCPLPVSIITQPSDTNVYPYQTAQFSVNASGSQPVTYQWYFSGTNISGASGSTLTLQYVQPSWAGQYYCTLSNAASSQVVTSTPANLTIATPPPCVSAPSGLISWWSAEGNAADNMGRNNGIPVGSPGFGPGEFGQAFNFNGSSQYVRVTNSPSLQFSNAMTAEAWVYPTAYNTSQGSTALCKYSASTPDNSSWSLGLSTDGRAQVLVSTNGNVAASFTYSTDVCLTNTWTHIAFTYDGANVNVYFNGALEGTSATTGNIFQGSWDLGIGANIGGGLASQFSGMIDEPAVFNRALSAGEISAIYNAAVSGFCPLPITILAQPTNQTVNAHGQAAFNFAVSGSQPISYQWYFNGTNLAGATNSSLALSNLSVNQSGTYYAIATNIFGGTATASNATLTVIPPPPCAPETSGIVSWWSAESNALDNAGGNNGTLVGSPAFTNGEVGLAFNFNGSSQYVRVLDAPNLRFSNAMTAEAWVFPRSYTSGSSSSVLVKFDAVPGINQRSWSFGIDGTSQDGFFGISPDGATGPFIYTTNTVPLNAWTHLAATYDGAKITIYFNGVAQSSTAITNNIFPGADALGIGANIGGGGPVALFNGLINEPAVYNRALSSNEIQAIYNAGVSGICATNFPPFASIVPSPVRVSPGGTANFDAIVSGSPTLSYQWKFNGTNITGATNRALAIANVSFTNVGAYTLQVSNGPASVFSATSQLQLVLVSTLGNNVLLTNSQYTFTNSVTIKLTNYYSNGDIFYTLDGSAPTPESALYTGPFVLTNNSTIRALGYNPDFQVFATSGPIGITFPPIFTLATATPGGGSITRNPSGSNYLANTSVTLTAVPSNGWTFLGWNGDAGGDSLSNTLLMDRNESVQAIFGTVVGNAVGGSGAIVFSPPGGVYPYGTILQASAVPQTGNFFVLWGDAVSGNVNPLTFPVTNANQTIAALFYMLDSGEVALSVVPVGPGTVAVNPPANSYSTGASVTITATPATNHTFVGWSGSASGTNNPLNIQLDQSETIYANFSTNKTGLLVYPVTRPGTADGMVIDLTGQPGAHYRLDVSSDLVTWSSLYNLTNYVGTIHYIDSSASNANHHYYRAQTIVP